MNSLKSDTYSGETYIYIFPFANNTVRHFFFLFFFLASKPKKQQMERKKNSF